LYVAHWSVKMMTTDSRQCTLDLRVYEDDITHAGVYTAGKV